MAGSIFYIQRILWPIPVPLVLNLACAMERMLSNARLVHSASCRMGRLDALYPVSLAQYADAAPDCITAQILHYARLWRWMRKIPARYVH